MLRHYSAPLLSPALYARRPSEPGAHIPIRASALQASPQQAAEPEHAEQQPPQPAAGGWHSSKRKGRAKAVAALQKPTARPTTAAQVPEADAEAPGTAMEDQQQAAEAAEAAEAAAAAAADEAEEAVPAAARKQPAAKGRRLAASQASAPQPVRPTCQSWLDEDCLTGSIALLAYCLALSCYS